MALTGAQLLVPLKITRKTCITEPCELGDHYRVMKCYWILFFQIPPKETWNGIPKRVALQYGNHQKIINVSHEELVHLNRSLEIEIHVNGLDVHSNYSVTAAFCTVGGCGNYSSPCFMYAGSEDPILKG